MKQASARDKYRAMANVADPDALNELFYLNRSSAYAIIRGAERAPECAATKAAIEESFRSRMTGTLKTKAALLAKPPMLNVIGDGPERVIDAAIREPINTDELSEHPSLIVSGRRVSVILKHYVRTTWKGLRQHSYRARGNAASPGEESMDQRLSWAEFKKCLKKLKNGKAPGPDGLKNECWKLAHPSLKRRLFELLRTCLALGMTPKAWSDGEIVLICKLKEG